MKKKHLRLLSFVLAAAALVGCGGTNGGGSSSSGGSSLPSGTTKAFQLKVFNFNGGYGSDWLKAVETRYEAQRAGKKFTVNGVEYDGVDVVIDPVKKTLGEMSTTYNFASNHVYFHEDVWYMNYLRQGNMLEDITEALVNENPYEPGKTLLDKLSAEQKAFYNVDGKYYGVPHYAGYVGLNYDISLFDKKGYWIKDGYSYDGNPSNLIDCFTAVAAEKSNGPDGVAGTDDDGLPATYDEFFMLCAYINQSGDIPLTWDNKNRMIYLNWFMQSLAASYEGSEQMSLNYTFDGTAKNLVSVSDDGVVTKLADTAITKDNGYELTKQAGKYYALSFIEKIADNEWYYSKDGEAQLDAQNNLIKGVGGKKVAMLIDGVWWENEADSTFKVQEQIGKPGRKESKYGFMPFPAATAEKAQERVTALQNGKAGYGLLDTHSSLCFIGKGIGADEKKIAIDFIQFAYTDESLVEFTTITDTTKAVNYTVSAADKAKMSTYGRSIITMQENAEVIHAFSKNTFYQNNETTFADYNVIYTSTVNGATAAIALDKFIGGVSAKTYFDGLYTYQQNAWISYAK